MSAKPRNPYSASLERHRQNRIRMQLEERRRASAAAGVPSPAPAVPPHATSAFPSCNVRDSYNVSMSQSFNVGGQSNVNFTSNTTFNVGHAGSSNAVDSYSAVYNRGKFDFNLILIFFIYSNYLYFFHI